VQIENESFLGDLRTILRDLALNFPKFLANLLARSGFSLGCSWEEAGCFSTRKPSLKGLLLIFSVKKLRIRVVNFIATLEVPKGPESYLEISKFHIFVTKQKNLQ
jgi:hypothetical protein